MEELALPPPSSPEPEPPPASSRLYPAWLRSGRATAVIVAITMLTDFAAYALTVYQRLESTMIGFMLMTWLVMNLLIFLSWSGLWALASRVIRQEANFLGHLNTALLTLLTWTWLGALVACAAFSLSIDAYSPILYYAFMWLLGTWALSGHLRLVSRAPGRRLSAAGGLIAGLVVGLVLAGRSLAMQKMPAMRESQVTVLPYFLRLAGPASIDSHVGALGRLQAAVDRRALEK